MAVLSLLLPRLRFAALVSVCCAIGLAACSDPQRAVRSGGGGGDPVDLGGGGDDPADLGPAGDLGPAQDLARGDLAELDLGSPPDLGDALDLAPAEDLSQGDPDLGFPDPDLGTPDSGPVSLCTLPERYSGVEPLEGAAFRNVLRSLVMRGQDSPTYDEARVIVFGHIDNQSGQVECVYTGRRVRVAVGGEPDWNEMNTEHTWPQSRGADREPAHSDLHHLFPVDSDANSRRGNNFFGDVRSVDWEEGGSKLGDDASGDRVFEPRGQHKGNVARALFYFSLRYDLRIEPAEERVLRRWHELDPVDVAELTRNGAVERYQHNRNPFIDCPHFVAKVADF